MKFSIRRTTQFRKDVKRMVRGSKDLEKLLAVIEELAEGRKLAPQYRSFTQPKTHSFIRQNYLRFLKIEPDLEF